MSPTPSTAPAFKPVAASSNSPPLPSCSNPAAFSAPLPPHTHAPSNTSVLPINNVPAPATPHSSSHTSSLPIHRTPFKPSAPVQIPRPRAHPKHHHLPLHLQNQHQHHQQQPVRIDLSPHVPIPRSLPNLPPCYPATLFGALSPDDEHVTVWEPLTGKTVAGNAAPYRRNLSSWLHAHPGWEEKADELKSSKRRSAARRARAAAHSFSVLCCYPVAAFLADDAAKRLAAIPDQHHCDQNAIMSWTSEDFVRLQEALFTLAQQCHSVSCKRSALDADRWHNVLVSVGGPKSQATVLYCAHHMLKRGIAKSQEHRLGGAAVLPSSLGAAGHHARHHARHHAHHHAHHHSTRVGSPASVSSFHMAATGSAARSLPFLQSELDASLLERSFRAPREPRVTVWNPANGRTISGNAAPCRRNLQAWMRLHPGWVPKEEGQLSSSRRNRNRKVAGGAPGERCTSPGARTTTAAAAAAATAAVAIEPESPHFNDALEGLLFLSRSPSGQMSARGGVVGNDGRMVMDEDMELSADDEEDEHGLSRGRSGGKKMALTSSVSSSSADEEVETMSDEEDGDAVMMEMYK